VGRCRHPDEPVPGKKSGKLVFDWLGRFGYFIR
jgi:hypothetical protein